jgi:transcriptional regulator with XRE-family HTH domain
MVGRGLMPLIEKHSDELALGLTDKLRASERTSDFRKISTQDLRRTTAEVYRNLGEWLLNKTEKDIEDRFSALAARRAAEGVSLHQFLWALIVSRNYLWQFLKTNALADDVVALYGKLELLQLLHQFFDRALYYGALGYETAQDPDRATIALSEQTRWVAK